MSDLQRRSEALLRQRGYLTASVERRKRFPDPKARKCQACGAVRFLDIASDMWNIVDLIAIRPAGRLMTTKDHYEQFPDIIFVQVTSSANHAARRNKIVVSTEARLCLLSGARILIQSWKKKDNRWQSQDEWISLDQFIDGLPNTAEQFYESERKRKQPDLPPGSTLPLSPFVKDEEMPF